MDGVARDLALAEREPSRFGQPTLWPALAWRLVKFVILLSVVIIIIVLAVTRNLPWQSPYQGPFSTNLPPNTLVANFGLQRVSLTRSTLVSTGTTAVSTPAIITARLSSDLIDSLRLQQFPADQITLTATPVGPRQIEIVAILNPVNPYKVADGLFKGSISVYTGSKILSVPIEVYLAPKSGYKALLAFLLLLLGAIFGLSVKWVTEALSSLSAARWRFNTILQVLGGSRGGLPTSAEDQLTEIRSRIKRQDLGGLDELFKPLEFARGPLREFSDNINNIYDDITRQERLQRYSRDLPINDVVIEERRRVRTLLSRQWPWENTAEILDEAKQLSMHVKQATRAMDQQRSDVLSRYAAGKFEEAYELSMALPQGKPKLPAQLINGPTAGPPPRTADPYDYFPNAAQESSFVSRWLASRDGRGIIQWMTDRPRTLAAIASILVVSIVGLQLQYLNSTSFDGSLAEWLSLLLWAAVVELSGVSVLDVVGRLSGSGPALHSGRA